MGLNTTREVENIIVSRSGNEEKRGAEFRHLTMSLVFGEKWRSEVS